MLPPAPHSPPPGTSSDLSRDLASEDTDARNRVLARVYDELRLIARAYLAREGREHTLAPTDVVNEAVLRLLPGLGTDDLTRGRLLGFAAHAMRQVLVDHARRRASDKRGGGWDRVTLGGLAAGGGSSTAAVDLLALDKAMTWLDGFDPELVRITEWHYFGGLTGDQIALQLGVSRATVTRQLALARSLLLSEIDRYQADTP